MKKEESDDDDEDYCQEEEVKRNPAEKVPPKRKRVVFVEPPEVKPPEPKKRVVVPAPSSSSSALTTLPQQGPLISLPKAVPVVPRPQQQAPPQLIKKHQQTLMPVKVLKISGGGGGTPGPSSVSPGPSILRRTVVPGIGAGGVGRLPLVRMPVRPPFPGSQAPAPPLRSGVAPTAPAAAPRQFVVPSSRVRVITTRTPVATTMVQQQQSPSPLMFPVRVVQRPGPSGPPPPGPPDRPGFGIYEKPRFSLGSRRSRGDSGPEDPAPPQPPPPTTSRPPPQA